jgi:hypothetical protein
VLDGQVVAGEVLSAGTVLLAVRSAAAVVIATRTSAAACGSDSARRSGDRRGRDRALSVFDTATSSSLLTCAAVVVAGLSRIDLAAEGCADAAVSIAAGFPLHRVCGRISSPFMTKVSGARTAPSPMVTP